MMDKALRFVSLMLFCSYVQLSAFQKLCGANNRLYDINLFVPPPHSQNKHFNTNRRFLLRLYNSNSKENDTEIIYVDESSSINNEISNDVFDEMNAGQPSEVVIMKDVSITNDENFWVILSILIMYTAAFRNQYIYVYFSRINRILFQHERNTGTGLVG